MLSTGTFSVEDAPCMSIRLAHGLPLTGDYHEIASALDLRIVEEEAQRFEGFLRRWVEFVGSSAISGDASALLPIQAS